MAAKWWRYNSTSHIFEQSLDEGTTWTKPPLNASIITEGVFDPARLGGSLAFTNVVNQFTLRQRISNAGGDWPRLTFTNVNAGADLKVWEIITHDNNLHIWALNDIENQVLGELTIHRNGQIGCTHITAAGNIHTSNGYMYPMALTGPGAAQTSWYLGSHSSYGLYTNTGLYLESNIWCNAVEARAHIRAGAGLHDYNRATPIGTWIAWAVGQGNFWSAAGTCTVYSVDYVYTIIGTTCFITFNWYANISVANTTLYCHIPCTAARTGQTNVVSFNHFTTASSIAVMAYTNAGSNYLTFYPFLAQQFSAGSFYFRGMVIVQF